MMQRFVLACKCDNVQSFLINTDSVLIVNISMHIMKICIIQIMMTKSKSNYNREIIRNNG